MKWFEKGDIVAIDNDQHPLQGCLIILTKVKIGVSHGYMTLPPKDRKDIDNIILVRNIPNDQAGKVGHSPTWLPDTYIDKMIDSGHRPIDAAHEDIEG